MIALKKSWCQQTISKIATGMASAYGIHDGKMMVAVSWLAATTGMSLIHEIGHLFGTQHDRGNANLVPRWPFNDFFKKLDHFLMVNNGSLSKNCLAFWDISRNIWLMKLTSQKMNRFGYEYGWYFDYPQESGLFTLMA